MDSILIIAAIIGIIYWIYTIGQKRKTVIVDENSFYQNGVRVEFTSGTITIGKHAYPVSKVTGIKSNTMVRQKASVLANSGTVDIEVDDFIKPVHKIIFHGYSVEKDTKEFSQRLSIALRKAGGPNFV